MPRDCPRWIIIYKFYLKEGEKNMNLNEIKEAIEDKKEVLKKLQNYNIEKRMEIQDKIIKLISSINLFKIKCDIKCHEIYISKKEEQIVFTKNNINFYIHEIKTMSLEDMHNIIATLKEMLKKLKQIEIEELLKLNEFFNSQISNAEDERSALDELLSEI